MVFDNLTLLHSERSKLHRVLAILSAVGLKISFSESISYASGSNGVKGSEGGGGTVKKEYVSMEYCEVLKYWDT